MIKLSANYCKSNNNFVILGIDNFKANKKIEYIQTIKKQIKGLIKRDLA